MPPALGGNTGGKGEPAHTGERKKTWKLYRSLSMIVCRPSAHKGSSMSNIFHNISHSSGDRKFAMSRLHNSVATA